MSRKCEVVRTALPEHPDTAPVASGEDTDAIFGQAEVDADQVYSRRWSILAVTLVGFFSTGFLITIVSASIPRIAQDLGASDASASWVLTGAMLAFGVTTPLMGRVADSFGHKKLYMAGLAASASLAILISLSWNIASLILFRLLWAAAGAAAGPASMAIIMRNFPPHERVRAMGWWSFVGAGAPVLGVVAGGPAVEAFSWRVVFAAQVPLSVVALLLGMWLLPSDRVNLRQPVDVLGAVLAGLAAGSLMFGINRGSEWGWTHPAVLACLAIFPVSVVAFFRAEVRATAPLLPPELVKQRNFVAPLLVHLLANFCYMGAFFITPFLLQRVFGFNVAKTGFFMLPRPVAFTLAAPVSGAVATRVGERKTVMAAMILMMASMGALAAGANAGSSALIVAGLVLSGVALGSASPSLSSTVANAVPPHYLATAGASSNLVSTVGSVVGMEALRSVAAASGGTRGAYALAYAAAGLLPLVALLPASLIRSLPRRRPDAGIPPSERLEEYGAVS